MQYRSTALKMSIRCYYLEKMFSVKLDYSRWTIATWTRKKNKESTNGLS
jgi:hypothetical protein